MVGASIHVVPFMIQRHVPGIGPYVIPAFLFAAVPAILAAFAYTLLSSAMPRAGGSYLYASRALSPYLGFVASFSQWFGLSIAIGVVAYITIPFLRDIAEQMAWHTLADVLNQGSLRILLALLLLWLFVFINVRGLKQYERTVVPLMFIMFGLGAIVIVAGFLFDAQDFAAALHAKEQRSVPVMEAQFSWRIFLSAAALMFSSFIGFDAIAQAGGEAKNPTKNLPRAIALAIFSVTAFYLLFTFSVYRVVPWSFVAQEAAVKDIAAPGLLRYVLPAGWAVLIMAGAAVALINDLPAMILSVSRLMFSWGEDGIFPKALASIHTKHHTPYWAIMASGLMATIGILGSHFAGDFFLGIDIMVTSMLVNFLLMCLSVIWLPKRNPALAANITVIKSPTKRNLLAACGATVLSGFLAIHIYKDLTTVTTEWYFHSTPVWLLVMALASAIFWINFNRMRKAGVDTQKLFSELPPE